MKNLSLLVPVYNEEKSVKNTTEELCKILENRENIEIILIDDGSTDDTSRLLQSVNVEGIKTLKHSRNKGYGAALKTGVRNSTNEYIAITDADGSYPNDRIPELFDKLVTEQGDMVIGARVGKIVKIGIFRRFGKFLLRKLAEYLSEEKILDLNSGLRIMRKELVLDAIKYLPNGFSFTTTLSLSFLANDYKIIYVPIDYYKRVGKSKIRPIHDTLNFVQLIVRTVMFFNPLKIFLPLSGFFIFLSLAVLLGSYFMGRVMDITSILLFVTGLHLLAIGLLADLIDKRLSK